MSDVKRYHVTEAGLVEGQALGRINVVLGADHDRVTAERDALQRELEQQKRYVEINANSAHGKHKEAMQYRAERDALQQLMTAADERVDVLEGLLRKSRDVLWAVQDDLGAISASAVGVMVIKIDCALKPAEGGGDDWNDRIEKLGSAFLE